MIYDREKRTAILCGAVVLSLAMHLTLLWVVGDCIVGGVDAAFRSHRKWSRDVPEMKVARFAGDPMARATDAAGRPSVSAPKVESVERRIDRIAEAEPPAATLAKVPVAAVETPPPVAPLEWKRAEANKSVVPVVESPSAPLKVTPGEESSAALAAASAAARAAASLPPPSDLVTRAATRAASPARTDPSMPAPPPVIVPAAVGDFGLKLPVVVEVEAPPEPEPQESGAARREAPRFVPSAQVMPSVDEAVVADEKAAVRDLRDRPAAKPKKLAGHVAFSLASWVDPLHPGIRYFRLRIASNPANPLDVVPKDVVYLLDASGSIANDRLKLCRNAIDNACRALNTGDRFNVVAFRDRFAYAFPEWRAAEEAAFDDARKWLAGYQARGWTDVFKTLRSVMAVPRDPARPVIACVVTDGEATSGVTESAEIISRFSELNGGLVSVYLYGVKGREHAYLLDMLARGNRGDWACHDGLRYSAAREMPGLMAKFANPVLTDVKVTFSAASNVDAYPRLVPHLNRDATIDVWGTCPADRKDVVFSLRGLNGVEARGGVFRATFNPEHTLDATAKTEWATRRLYAMVEDYTRSPSPELMRDLRLFAAHYRIDVPYLKELGKTK